MDFDWIAIALSTIVAGGLGAAWYSPALFGPAWMAEIGLAEGEAGPGGREIAGSLSSGWSTRLYLIRVGHRAICLILIGGIQGWFAA